MFKTKFAEKTKKQKILTVLCAGVLIFLTVAVVLGIVSALTADGEWTLWSSYRYDDTGYEIGSATVPSDAITAIDIDWLDGEVEVILCKDAYLSVTETSAGELAENALLRWNLSGDGTNFSVKYRKSAAFLGFGGGGDDKKLTVRIPENMIGRLTSLTVNSKAASVTVSEVSVGSLSLTSISGTLTVTGGTYTAITATSKSGAVNVNAAVLDNASLTSRKGSIDLTLPEQTGFALTLNCDANRFSCDRTLHGTGTGYTYGDGACKLTLSSEKGAVRLHTQK